jgi:hypothetical protein
MKSKLDQMYNEIETGWNVGLKKLREGSTPLTESARKSIEETRNNVVEDMRDANIYRHIGVPGAAESSDPGDDIEHWQEIYDWCSRILSIIDEMLAHKTI